MEVWRLSNKAPQNLRNTHGLDVFAKAFIILRVQVQVSNNQVFGISVRVIVEQFGEIDDDFAPEPSRLSGRTDPLGITSQVCLA